LTGATVRASVFLTPPGARGLALHRDNRHVVAIQVEGVKTWDIYTAPDDEQWSDGRIDDSDGEPSPVALAPGDVLGMVRGSPHRATANDQPTVHLTFSFEAPSLRECLRALAYEALEDVPDKAVLSGPDDPRLHERLDALLERMRAAAGTKQTPV
jgi:ribosomal protein L16 Arg81 hydroxylase